MSEVERFAFPQTDNQLGMASSLPYLPLTLNYQNRELTVSGLLDTGATINVMPYQIGLQLCHRNCGAISTSTFSFCMDTSTLSICFFGVQSGSVVLSDKAKALYSNPKKT
ncbi:hypothetical protein PN36_34790, partial [Candidatus Thiomargarita nelsonii]